MLGRARFPQKLGTSAGCRPVGRFRVYFVPDQAATHQLCKGLSCAFQQSSLTLRRATIDRSEVGAECTHDPHDPSVADAGDPSDKKLRCEHALDRARDRTRDNRCTPAVATPTKKTNDVFIAGATQPWFRLRVYKDCRQR